MGLLDDAIREHLELKRRGGAEPGKIAQVERETLEPEDPYAPATSGTEDEPSAEEISGSASVDASFGTGPSEVHDPVEELAEQPASTLLEPLPEVEDVSSWAAQETAEIDMQTVLAEEVETANEPPGTPGLIDQPEAHEPPTSTRTSNHSAMLYSHQEEPLEGDDQPERTTPTPQQEHLSFE